MIEIDMVPRLEDLLVPISKLISTCVTDIIYHIINHRHIRVFVWRKKWNVTMFFSLIQYPKVTYYYKLMN